MKKAYGNSTTTRRHDATTHVFKVISSSRRVVVSSWFHRWRVQRLQLKWGVVLGRFDRDEQRPMIGNRRVEHACARTPECPREKQVVDTLDGLVRRIGEAIAFAAFRPRVAQPEAE